jgi:hypothetical protein
MVTQNSRRETVFLSGTDRVQDVLSVLYDELGEYFQPLWFRKPDFPLIHNDAMTNCLKVAQQCDRMIAVVDERGGLLYRKTGRTITENEFLAARKRGVPCLVFVRSKIWSQSRVYHRHLKGAPLDEDGFRALGLDGDQAVYEFIERLQHLQTNGTPEVPWIEPFNLPQDIVEAVKAKWVLPESDKRVAVNVGDEDAVLQEYPGSSDVCSEDDIHKLIADYSDYLPDQLRTSMLASLIQYGWSTIVFQPFLASEIMINAEFRGDVKKLLVPICKAGLRHEITSEEIEEFISVVEHNKVESGEIRKHDVLLSRMLRHLFYDQPTTLDASPLKERLYELSLSDDTFWRNFFIDIYFRFVCNVISLTGDIKGLIETACREYVKSVPSAPLSRIWPFIVSSYENSLKYKDEEVLLTTLTDIAKDCSNLIECRWSMTALFRTAPLLDFSEDELDYSSLVTRLMEQFDSSLMSRSPQMRFLQLHNLLKSFLRTKHFEYLARYESLYAKNRLVLFPPQRSHLQLEYASALYIALQFLDEELLRQLKFSEVMSSGRPLENTLFNNPLLNREIKLNKPLPANSNKRLIFKWLGDYAGQMYVLFAKRMIEENPIRITQFAPSKYVYRNRVLFSTSVLKSLEDFSERGSSTAPAFYARSTASFNLIPKQSHLELMRVYVQKALEADIYSIIRNAKDIANGIYSCFYYGPSEYRQEMIRLIDKLYEKTRIGNSPPKMHWAYYGGIKFQTRKIEGAFVEALYKESRRLDHRVKRLNVRKDQETGVEFTDSMKTTIANYAAKQSYFAIVLSNDLVNPETWNLLATTVLNTGDKENSQTFAKAAIFYSLAKCFARTRKDYDQKYCYNYIRCTSHYYDLADLLPHEFFVKDSIMYLRKRSASYFAYRNESTRFFFEFIASCWEDFSSELRNLICESLPKLTWLSREVLEPVTSKCRDRQVEPVVDHSEETPESLQELPTTPAT